MRSDFDFHSGKILKMKEGSMTTVLDQGDVRLDERQIEMINQMIDQGVDPREAKLRVMCIAIPPDHYKAVPGKGLYPRMLYKETGKTKTVNDSSEHQNAIEAGWSDAAFDSNLERPKEPSPNVQVPVAMAQAVEKRRRAQAK